MEIGDDVKMLKKKFDEGGWHYPGDIGRVVGRLDDLILVVFDNEVVTQRYAETICKIRPEYLEIIPKEADDE